MSKYTVATTEVGVYEKTLVANTVDTVEFASNLSAVEVFKDDGEAIYLTVDDVDPTVGGKKCWCLPAGVLSARVVLSKVNAPTVIRLISAGTPTYGISRGE